MKKIYKILISLFLIFSLIIVGVTTFVYVSLNKKIVEDKLIIVQKGTGPNKLVKKLKNNNIINNEFIFKIYIKIRYNKLKIKYGEYFFKKNTKINDIIENIINGRVHYRTITFAEGLSTKSILSIIEKNEFLIGEIPDNVEEGSLLPQTYKFQSGDTKSSLIKRMQNDMLKILDKYWDKRDKNLPVKTKQEALILASIVEKETSVKDERKLVASVFINRLKIGMPLQSDPTAIYGYAFGDVSKEKDIKTYFLIRKDSPYNTYKIKRLPPTPICNPGEESIKAVLNPAKTDYLFFVATGNGGHNFSTTYFEHRKQVKSLGNTIRNNNHNHN